MIEAGLWIMLIAISAGLGTLVVGFLSNNFDKEETCAIQISGITFLIGFLFVIIGVANPHPPTAKELRERKERQAQIDEQKKPKLFSTDDQGCSVYRFFSDSNEKFYVVCPEGSSITTNGTERQGKKTVEESITSVRP